MKPTKAQKERLRKIAAGCEKNPDKIATIADADEPGRPMEAVLHSRGWIEIIEDVGTGKWPFVPPRGYRITEAGLKALKGGN